MIDGKVVKRIAQLSGLGVCDEDVSGYADEMNKILGWVEQLNAVDITGVDAMVGTEAARLRMREDIVTDGDCLDAVLSNAPERIGDFYAVPKVVE